MADAVVSALTETLVKVIQNEAHYICEFPEQLSKMKTELVFIQSYLKDTSTVKLKDRKETLKTTMGELRELLYDAEDSIAKYELMLLKQQRKHAFNYLICSPSFLMFRYRMGKKLSHINQDIESLKERMTSYLGTSATIPTQERVLKGRQPMRHPVLTNEAEIVGLEGDSKKIMNWFRQARGPLTVIGIVGMGGIGKSTLAQKIYNSNDVKKHFEPTLIVVVSQSFELKELIKDMLRKLHIEENSFMRDEDGLLRQLRDQLRGKFLLILDDIWTTDGGSSWWESLKSALYRQDDSSNDGSCVIVTTRTVEVARSLGAIHIYQPPFLSEEDSWSLFSKTAFVSGQCPNTELESISKEIVAQCGGLPLAIKVVGGMMRGKEPSYSEWKQASDHLKEELAVHKDELVISTLRLSYEELPLHLKPCMLCLTAFSEDSTIYFKDVIYWWIGEGFVQERDGKTAFETGEEWWTELISRGLLLGVSMDYFQEFYIICRVHDIVRDMLLEIAREENFMGLDTKGNPSLNTHSRRLCIMKPTTDDLFVREDISKLVRLRTLFWRNPKEIKFIPKLSQFKWLRVLDVQFNKDYEKEERWDGIGSFPLLIYLRIKNSRSRRLLDSIENLRNLQVLCLHDCSNLETLPVQIRYLKKLTVLEIWGCNSIKYYPTEIGELSNLQYLHWIKPSAVTIVGEGCSMSEWQKLSQLRLLKIEIDSEDQIGDKELHVLSQLKQLKTLAIELDQGGNRNEQRQLLLQKVDYDFSPCYMLEELYLYGFSGERTPAWLNPTTLPNLRFLRILRGNMICMHPVFFEKGQGENWKLETLLLNKCENLEEEWPRLKKAMPFLKLLKVDFCPKLKLFPCDVEKSGGIWRKEDDKKNKRACESNSVLSFLNRIMSCVDCE